VSFFSRVLLGAFLFFLVAIMDSFRFSLNLFTPDFCFFYIYIYFAIKNILLCTIHLLNLATNTIHPKLKRFKNFTTNHIARSLNSIKFINLNQSSHLNFLMLPSLLVCRFQFLYTHFRIRNTKHLGERIKKDRKHETQIEAKQRGGERERDQKWV